VPSFWNTTDLYKSATPTTTRFPAHHGSLQG
jgi:hypothetical protein